MDVKNTLMHFRHELDGVAFAHQEPEPHRGVLLKAGTKNMFGMGDGFRKRFAVVDARPPSRDPPPDSNFAETSRACSGARRSKKRAPTFNSRAGERDLEILR